ncbi:hypothetical protein VTK56DRAFT_5949 [Thermocarpiscus australiensis]
MSSTPTALAALAKTFKSLHVPGDPVVLANVYDATSARAVASLPGCRALATASHAVALALGTTDEQLTLEQNLAGTAPIAAVARARGLPLTVDLQDGYGERLEEAVRGVIALGAVGANLEDSVQREEGRPGVVMDEAVAVERVRRAVQAAAEAGVPDFVVNARSDSFLFGGTLEESISRGRKYLEAGATTVYVLWPMGVRATEKEVKKVVEALDGKVNLLPVLSAAGREGKKPLTSADMARLGAARVSIGPQLYYAAVQALKAKANEVFGVAE